MSQVPGAVSIQVVGDFTSFDASMAARRNQPAIAIPVGAAPSGIAGAPGPQPATFGAPGATPFAGVVPNASTTAAAGAAGAAQNQAAAQMGVAAQQIFNAAQIFHNTVVNNNQAFYAAPGVPAPAPPGGGGGGAGGGGGGIGGGQRGLGRLARLLLPGYAAFYAIQGVDRELDLAKEERQAEFQHRGEVALAELDIKQRNSGFLGGLPVVGDLGIRFRDNLIIPFDRAGTFGKGRFFGRFNEQTQEEAENDIDETRQNELDQESYVETRRQRRGIDISTRSIDRTTSALSIRPGVERGRRQIGDQYEEERETYLAKIQSDQEEINNRKEANPLDREAGRMQERLNGFIQSGRRRLEAQQYNTAAQQAEIVRSAQERAETQAFRQGAQNESLGIVTNSQDLKVGQLAARANDVKRATEQQALDIFRSPDILDVDRQGLANQALRGGALRLKEQQQSFFRDLQPEQLDSINQQATDGAGTTDASEAIKAQADAMAELNKLIGANLPQILQILQNLKGK